MSFFLYKRTVHFYETDMMGIVHHGNYLRYYEEARVAWADARGLISRPEDAAQFAVLARTHSGCEVSQQDFLKLDLPENHFDGVFANAALFHVPSQELPRVLLELHASLKPRGVLFSSNPHGHNEEGWNGGRYGAYHDLETWRRYMSAAGFVELDHYYRPAGLPREQQPWLASVWRR